MKVYVVGRNEGDYDYTNYVIYKTFASKDAAFDWAQPPSTFSIRRNVETIDPNPRSYQVPNPFEPQATCTTYDFTPRVLTARDVGGETEYWYVPAGPRKEPYKSVSWRVIEKLVGKSRGKRIGYGHTKADAEQSLVRIQQERAEQRASAGPEWSVGGYTITETEVE